MDSDPSNKQNTSKETEGASNTESTKQFVMQVKNEIEECLKAYMTKEEMFQELRQKGIHPEIAFAVYKEFRRQNHDFFKAYYWKIDLNKQIERFNRLLDLHCQIVKQRETSNPTAANHGDIHPSSATGLCRGSATAAQPAAPVMIPDPVPFSNHQARPFATNFSHPGSSRRVHEFAAWALSHPVSDLQPRQSPHHLHQSVPGGGALGPSAAGPSNAMASSWPPSYAGGWHVEQPPPPLQQSHPGSALESSLPDYSLPVFLGQE